MWGSFHFSFFGQSDQNMKKSFSGKMRIFYTENKQTGQLIFFVFGHFDQKTKNEKWNESDKKIQKTTNYSSFKNKKLEKVW